jgi:hypothetical protein
VPALDDGVSSDEMAHSKIEATTRNGKHLLGTGSQGGLAGKLPISEQTYASRVIKVGDSRLAHCCGLFASYAVWDEGPLVS